MFSRFHYHKKTNNETSFIVSFQDEVLAISDKVILRADDLLTWITTDLEWNWGLRTTYNKHSAKDSMITTRFLSKHLSLNFEDIDKEKHAGK